MDRSSLTTPSLIVGLNANDSVYWERLDFLYGPIVVHWITRAGVPAGDVEDVRQDVFAAAAKNISQYQHNPNQRGSLRRWLWGIARNKITDFRRKEAKRIVAEGGTAALDRVQQLPADPYEDSDPDTSLRVRKELCARALSILESDFEPKTWKAFWLTVIEDRTAEEASAELGMTKQAIRQARYRVIRRLRDELGDELPV